MNCQSFEKIIRDLARDQIMIATTREAATDHANSCARCAARLADERALTDGLRAVAQSTEATQAPPRIEAALLAAFRERKTAAPASASMPALSAPVQFERARPRRWTRWAIAAAAAVVLLLGALVLARFEPATQVEPPAITRDVKPAQPIEDAPTAQTAPPQTTEQNVAAQNKQRLARNVSRRVDKKNTIETSATRPHSPTRAAEAEIATEFLPLMNWPGLAPFDGGHVVRVELPRSALVSLGLPMNVNRADERVKADVLVGNDGLARAVRFVR